MDQPLCNLGLPGFLRVFQLLLGRNYLVRKPLETSYFHFCSTIVALPVGVKQCSPLLQAFPEAAAFVLCVCQHAELGVRLAGHHLAHPAQPTARDPACGVPQTPRAPRSTGTAESHTDTHAHTHSFSLLPYSLPVSKVYKSI